MNPNRRRLDSPLLLSALLLSLLVPPGVDAAPDAGARGEAPSPLCRSLDDEAEGDDGGEEPAPDEPAVPPEEQALSDAVSDHISIPAPPARRNRVPARSGLGDDRESRLMQSEQRFSELRETWPGTRAAEEALYWIAECQREVGDHEIARDTYRRASATEGGGTRAAEIRLGWGRAEIELEDCESALSRLEEIARIAPDAPEVAESLYWRGIALRELGRFEEAEEVWQRLRRALPGTTAARRAGKEKGTLRPVRDRLAEWIPEYQRQRAEYDQTARNQRTPLLRALENHLDDLSTAKGPETEQYLLSLFDKEVGEVRAAVISPLLAVGGPRAAQRILKDVKSLDEGAMTALMSGLQRKHFKSLRLRVFEEQLRMKQRRNSQNAAIDLFGRVGTAEAIRALVLTIPEGDAGNRLSPADRNATTRIEGRLRRVRDPKALRYLGSVLGGKGDTLRRSVVADSLGYTGDEKAAEPLRAAMFDPSDAVASAAVRSVGRLGILEASEEIARLLLRRRGDEAFVKEAVRALGQLDPSRAEEALLAVSDARDRTIRALVVRNLGRVGTRAALDRIIEALADPAWQVRSAALEATVGRAEPELVEGLIALLEREDGALLPKIIARLIALLGVDRGPNAADWREYWEFAREKYDPAAALAGGGGGGPKGMTFVRRANPDAAASPSYFGVEIISKRIAFVVDISGSMQAKVSVPSDDGGTTTMRRIDLARDELLRAIESLRPGTTFNIVKFDTQPVSWKKKPVQLSRKSVAEAAGFARGLQPAGATNIFDSLELVLRAGEVDTVFLLSDGAPSAGRHVEPAAILREITRLNEESQVTIHTIALGFASEFMRELAERNRGNYILAGN